MTTPSERRLVRQPGCLAARSAAQPAAPVFLYASPGGFGQLASGSLVGTLRILVALLLRPACHHGLPTWVQGVPQGLPAAGGCAGKPPEWARHAHPPGQGAARAAHAFQPFLVAAPVALDMINLGMRQPPTITAAPAGPPIVLSAYPLLSPPLLQVRVFGPRSDPLRTLGHEVAFTSPQLAEFAACR